MSIRLPRPQTIPDPEETIESGSSSSESEGDEDQNWDDWVSDSNEQQECRSLFDEAVLPSVEAAVKHDISTHSFDINEFSSKLGTSVVLHPGMSCGQPCALNVTGFDFHGRVRLINYIRKNVSA